jgi:hypothetical protein
MNPRGILRVLPRLRDPLRIKPRLFDRGECLVKTRLATIGGVAMNDAVLGRFVDSRNRGANLIGAALWGGADLFLQSAQMRLNAPITCGSSKGLSGTFSG